MKVTMPFAILFVYACCASMVAAVGLAARRTRGGGDNSAAAVTQHMNDLMVATNQNLARAERHHKKAVNKARREIHALVDQEAGVLRKMLSDFRQELACAMGSVNATLLDARAALALQANDSTEDDHMKLTVATSIANAALVRAQRRATVIQHQAASEAVERLQEEASSLERRLGDLSEIFTRAADSLASAQNETVSGNCSEQQAQEEGDATSAIAVRGNSSTDADGKDSSRSASLFQELRSADKVLRSQAQAAQLRLSDRLAQRCRHLSEAMANTTKALDEAQKVESSIIAGKK